ncbi:MAG: hypothetical protein HWD60_17495 [Defluviicoccus sp.]|nr:MAG: hypothetical protein HWD60_17495 [Defluviicoccus sp.]
MLYRSGVNGLLCDKTRLSGKPSLSAETVARVPEQPLKPGRYGAMTRDDKRNGTTTVSVQGIPLCRLR